MITLTELIQHISFDTVYNHICTLCKEDNIKEDYKEIYKELNKATPYCEENPYKISISQGMGVILTKRRNPIPFNSITVTEWGKAVIDDTTFASNTPTAIAAQCILCIHTSAIITDAKRGAKEWAQKATYAKLHYDRDCNDLANIFCAKHDFYTLDNVDTYWIAEKPGEILSVGDFVFDMTDIIIDLMEEIEEEAIFEWYDYTLECSNKGQAPAYNYLNWYKHVYSNKSKKDS